MAVRAGSRDAHEIAVLPAARSLPRVARNPGTPSSGSTRILALLAIVGLAAWVYNQYLEELQDQADVEDALVALVEAEELGTIPWEDIKRYHGL